MRPALGFASMTILALLSFAAAPLLNPIAFAQPAGNRAQRQAHAANVSLEVYQRTTIAGQKARLRVSLYNLRVATVKAYPVSFGELLPNARLLASGDATDKTSIAYRVKHFSLQGRGSVASATAKPTSFYYDSWRDKDVGLSLPEGLYIVEATGEGGARARTWLAVSSRAIYVKRSPDKVLAWLVNAKTGQPVVGAWLSLTGDNGPVGATQTGADGLARFAEPRGSQWCIVAAKGGPPAFVHLGKAEAPDPYKCYLYTDRPVYRPGHLVRFRGTVRKTERVGYSLPADIETVIVRIKAAGGSTVYQETIPLNEWGTFAGEFQLAPEPPLGPYDIITEIKHGKESTFAYGSFEVLAYRKPEFSVDVKIPEKHFIGGDTIPVTISADYYFGGPVSGGKLSYEVNFREHYNRVPTQVLTAAGLGSAASTSVESDFNGEARLDKDGKFTLDIKTRYVPTDRSVHVKATVSELALRPQEAEASTTIHAAKLNLSISPEHSEYLAKETPQIQVFTRDLDYQPVSAAAKVILIEHKTDREGRSYEERTEKLVETNDRGEATVPFPVKRPGHYQVEAWAKDDLGNPVYAHTSFSVVEKRAQRLWPALELSAVKGRYQPGETANLRVQTDLLDSWMLVTVEGDGLYDAKVYKVGAHEFALKVPVLEHHKPYVTVSACIVRNGEATRASIMLHVPHDERRLQVLLTPDKELYEPAQTAKFTVTTRDSKGTGVPAEVGLGLVDASVYEIREDNTPDAFGFFWGARLDRVESAFSLDHLYPGGGMQAWGDGGMAAEGEYPQARMAAALALPPAPAAADGMGGGGEPEGPRLRTKFADTAFWGPSIVTGPDGSGEVSFEVPDNLTTWRGTARGLDRNSNAGQTMKEVKVSLPLLVRLTLPRFYVAEDEGTAAAIVHNYTKETRNVRVALSAEGAEVLGAAEQTIELAPEGIRKLTWRIVTHGPNEAKFLVSAIGGPGASDAMQAIVPVIPSGVKDVIAAAGMTSDRATASLDLPAEIVPGSAELTVTLSPSLAGPIFEALEYLTSYPYGCAEQTMSSFLPDVIVARTLAKLGAKRPKPKMLDRFVSFGLQKLLRYQHNDGGWHWWEFDQSDPFISAYVVYGLKLADEAGYIAAHDAMVRGAAYLRKALHEQEFAAPQTYILWALAHADAWDKDSLAKAAGVAQDLYKVAEKLDVFSQASLAMAMGRMAKAPLLDKKLSAPLAEAGSALAAKLDAAALKTGTASHWTSGGYYRYSWVDNDVEVTSQVMRALMELRPQSGNIQGAVRWLMAARRGKAWVSSKDSASAVLALTGYLERQTELSPDFTARVLLRDREVGTARMSAEDVFADPKTITVKAADLRAGANALRLEKTGQGNLYWTARLSYLIPAEKAIPLARGVSVKRVYHLPAEDPIGAGSQSPGTVISVDLTVNAEDNLRYVLLEEPIPAGCEVVVGDDRPEPWERWSHPWDRREVWDNRLVFYFDYLSKGEHTFTYVLRAEAPGQYRILPAVASLMYFPEVRGSNRLVRMRVAEEQP